MEDHCDVVERLLQSTGLSCDDLLLKLQKYKSVKETKNKSQEQENSLNLKPRIHQEQENIVKNCPVILDTKSSTLKCDNDKLFDCNIIASSSENDSNGIESHDKFSANNVEKKDEEMIIPLKPSDETIVSDEATKSEEDLRNILRLQLSSLRNMKKSSGYLSDLKKKSAVFHNLKKKRKSCHLDPWKNEVADENTEETLVEENNTQENGLFSQKEEINFLSIEKNCDFNKLLKPSEETEKEDNTSSIESSNLKVDSPTKVNLQKRRNQEESSPIKVKKFIREEINEDSRTSDVIKNSEKSPFVSDSLEDFLNESAKLQVSYPIPKLGAEEGITEKSKKNHCVPVSNRVVKSERKNYQKEKPKLIKAKTLAEMRRQFEKLKSKSQTGTSDVFRPKKPKTGNFLIKISCQRNSFVIYNNRKIWVNSKIDNNKCVGIIQSNTKKNEETKDTLMKKPSLLSALSHNKRKPMIKYRAGPLCKKYSLQDEESKKEWTTEIKKLPKVFLEIIPQLGKPIRSKLVHLLPIFNEEIITEERANFALSVLKPKNGIDEVTPFKFQVSYNNKQEKFLVRKPCVKKVVPTCKIEENPQVEVNNVLRDIITYVEIKEIEDGLIKQDEDTRTEEIASEEPDTNLKHRNRKNKRKKLEMELFRLNCKVIDVATEKNEDIQCNKPFCKMGCVCNSLQCKTVFSNHCQLVECMFGCKCSPDSRTSSHNSLSVHTVNHLEDKVKKDLAKEEREFTQTLIHTDNDVILVGKGNVRRTSKAPKKYRDYVGDIDDILDTPKPPTKPFGLSSCKVLLKKCDLDNLIPLCLTHQAYDCFCKGEILDRPLEKREVVIQPPKLLKKKEPQKNVLQDICARVRPVFRQYIERNKEPLYKERLVAKYSAFKYSNKDEELEETIDPICDDIKIEPLKKISKRKQSFNVREEIYFPEQFAMQRRKRKMKSTIPKSKQFKAVFDGEIKLSLKDNEEMVQTIGEEYRSMEYLRILPWEKLIGNFHSGEMKIWSKQHGSSTLLCNTALFQPPKNFMDIRNIMQSKSDIINWIITDELPIDIPRELMNVILTPKKTHFAISGYCLKNINNNQKVERLTKVEQPTETSKSEEIQIAEPEDLKKISLVELRETSKFEDSAESETLNLELIKSNEEVKVIKPFLMNAVVESSTTKVKTYSKQLIESSTNSKLSSQILIAFFKYAKQNNEEVLNKTVKCFHKDMNNRTKSLSCTSKIFMKRKLFLSKGKKGFEVTASLPLLKPSRNFRWRMIYLNSDFTFLSFSSVKYSIKYTDLLDVVKLATSRRYTITLRNEEFCDCYKHPVFGIFCVPEHQDRLFIGPFLPTEKHNIETYRYLRGNLVETCVFNSMVGREVGDKNPVWIYETPCTPLVLPRGLVIDITHDDEDQEQKANLFLNSLLCPPFVEELTLLEMRTRVINRYIVTNIPYLGYFGAYQRNTKAIDIFWPHGKGYRFPNVTFAKNLMVLYLSQVLCPIPRDFKINVIILTHLDLNTSKPVNSKYLSQPGGFFCGEFGIYDKHSLPDSILQSHNISIDSLLKFQRKTENDEGLIRLFGLFLMTNEELRKHPEPEDILRWATSEIYILRKLMENYETEKVDLLNMIQVNSQKIKGKATVAETIEIEDSDEEDLKTMNGKPQNNLSLDRSLLKSKMWFKTGRSLLKTSTIEGQTSTSTYSKFF